MTNNLLVMLPGEFLRVTEDITFDINDIRYSYQLADALNIQYLGNGWASTDVLIPAGTIFKVGSYRVTNNTNPRYNYCSLLIASSPDGRYVPKSRGGHGRRVTIRPDIPTFITWPLERVPT